jgi:hypothetical protein
MSGVYKILGSTVIGRVFHFFWFAVFLATRHISNDTLPKVKWIFAPIINFAEILACPLVAYGLTTAVVYLVEQ